jgi:hypothetical protein
MYLRELTTENVVDDAVIFHDTLNPKLWKNNQLKPLIRFKLLQIAKHFIDFIKIPNINLKDITISGSNAAFTYTKHSDIDLHLIVDIPSDLADYLTPLYDAKKNQYNFNHDVKIKGIDVEVYVQNSEQPHHSAGIFSILDNAWISEPQLERVNINDDDVQDKVNNYMGKITAALQDDNIGLARDVSDEIAKIRKSGLASGGEFSIENLAFKVLRAKGYINKLKQHINNLEDKALSLENQQ